MSDPNLSPFIWSVADLLRRDYKQSEYGKVILPFTVLCRLDCVLETTKSESRKGHPREHPGTEFQGRPTRSQKHPPRPLQTLGDAEDPGGVVLRLMTGIVTAAPYSCFRLSALF